MDARTLTVKDIVQMTASSAFNNGVQIWDHGKVKRGSDGGSPRNPYGISDELGNICNELSELNSGLGMIGTMMTIDMLVKMRPEMKDKVAPLINELVNGLSITLSDLGEENIS